MNDKIKFEFTVDETNVIMAALVRLPYETVAMLVANIHEQAKGQVGENDGKVRTVPPPR